ncbi:MAG: ABC transporter permease [Coriobacteriales bacterium]
MNAKDFKQGSSLMTTDELSSLYVSGHEGASAADATTRRRAMTPAKRRFVASAVLAALLLLVIVFGGHLVPFDPYTQDLSAARQPPGPVHLLGTDEFGRDLLARVIDGGRCTVFASLALVAIITMVGGVLGTFCGWHGGKADVAIMRVADLFLAFPGMVFAIAVAGVLVGGLSSAVIALACISWPKYARLARGLVITTKQTPYVEAARLSGRSGPSILARDILPNIAAPIVVTSAIDIGHMIIEIAGLSFLGLGAQAPLPEWGAMMSNGRSLVQLYPWIVLAPGTACFVTVAVFNVFADACRDLFDPRSRDADGGRRRARRAEKPAGTIPTDAHDVVRIRADASARDPACKRQPASSTRGSADGTTRIPDSRD